ncbi:MAG: metallopeptidase [Planctomyces sp.]|nr:metallopeptidase [Planctomyces sp.]
MKQPPLVLTSRWPATLLLLAVCASFVLREAFASDDRNPHPTSHETRSIEGWTVHVDARLLAGDHQPLGERSLKLLAGKLFEVSLVVPASRLEKLREAPIWLDLSHGRLESMQYHPSVDWLTAHGYSADLARCVHIPKAALFADSEHNRTQPWAVLHELAHAYHDRELGFDDARIVAAYDRYRTADRGKAALHVDGDPREHYARTNPMEFFAEFSEAYFGTNDFYPFVRGELRQDSPEIFELLEEVWGARGD